MPREALLARTLVQLADNLVADFDVVELLTLLADSCVDVLDIAAAGIMLAAPDGVAPGHRVVDRDDAPPRAVRDPGAGRALLRLFSAAVSRSTTGTWPTAGDRWPRFAAEALAAGFHSVNAVPMRLRGNVIGALNLFHDERGGMSAADLEAAQAFADIATIAILQHRAAREAQVLNDQLNHALNSRIVIEQAKGIVAERQGLDMDEAFATMRSYARRRNLRLADVATDVIAGSLAPADLQARLRPLNEAGLRWPRRTSLGRLSFPRTPISMRSPRARRCCARTRRCAARPARSRPGRGAR